MEKDHQRDCAGEKSSQEHEADDYRITLASAMNLQRQDDDPIADYRARRGMADMAIRRQALKAPMLKVDFNATNSAGARDPEQLTA